MSNPYAVGDVVDYDTLTRPNRWCREGTAIGTATRDGRVILCDTYWSGGSETHVLTDAEIATARLRFNLGDYDELDRYSHRSPVMWKTYAPADRQTVTAQHGCHTRWFVRKGASPDWATQIANAREVVAERELDVASAQRQLDWAREDLARVLAGGDQ